MKKIARSASGYRTSHTEVTFHEPEPKQHFHDQKDASGAIQTRESVDRFDDTKDVSADQIETTRVALEVSNGDDQHEGGDTAATYPAGWKLAAIMVGLCFACILVALVYSHMV